MHICMVQSNINMKRNDKIAKVYTYGSFALGGLLTAAKLLGWLSWSWWWVTAPVWVNLVLAVVLVIWANIWFRKYGKH